MDSGEQSVKLFCLSAEMSKSNFGSMQLDSVARRSRLPRPQRWEVMFALDARQSINNQYIDQKRGAARLSIYLLSTGELLLLPR